VCIAIAPVDSTPLPVGVPKTGYMIESMGMAAVRNIKSLIEQKPMEEVATWNAICLADIGHTGAAFIAEPQVPPRNVAWMKKGFWVLWLKLAFEKYFLYKMKRGMTEPWYEKFILKLLNAKKLK
jgi:sulfide:quinone oxidoreductase